MPCHGLGRQGWGYWAVALLFALTQTAWADGITGPESGSLVWLPGASASHPAAERLAPWIRLLSSLRNRQENEQVRTVNAFFNQIPQVSDRLQWGVDDYWASPQELLIANGGDCEDFAIAKYVTLSALGVPDSRLRITYALVLRQRPRRVESHMVLVVDPVDGGPSLVLDNLRGEPTPVSLRSDLVLGASFNASGTWAVATGTQRRGKPLTQPPVQWRQLLTRMPVAGVGSVLAEAAAPVTPAEPASPVGTVAASRQGTAQTAALR